MQHRPGTPAVGAEDGHLADRLPFPVDDPRALGRPVAGTDEDGRRAGIRRHLHRARKTDPPGDPLRLPGQVLRREMPPRRRPTTRTRYGHVV
jgi:hypothetical protein